MESNELHRQICKSCKTMTRVAEGYEIDWYTAVPRIVETATRYTKQQNYLKHSCGNYLRGTTIQGKYSDKVDCGEKCISATGPACECKCKGENHGGMAA